MGAGGFHDAILQLRRAVEVATPPSTDELCLARDDNDALDRFLASVVVENTRLSVKSAMRRWVGFLADRGIRPEDAKAVDLDAWRALLSQQGLKPGSIEIYSSGVKRFYRWLGEQDNGHRQWVPDVVPAQAPAPCPGAETVPGAVAPTAEDKASCPVVEESPAPFGRKTNGTAIEPRQETATTQEGSMNEPSRTPDNVAKRARRSFEANVEATAAFVRRYGKWPSAASSNLCAL